MHTQYVDCDGLLVSKSDFAQYVNRNVRPSRGWAQGWTTPDAPERDFSASDRRTAMAMARQKVEESPIAMGIIQTLADNVVGQGYRLSMITADAGYNADVQARWDEAKNSLDIRGVRSWGRLLRMWYMRRVIDGDVGVLRVPGASLSGYEPSFLQTIEADRIFKTFGGTDDGATVDSNGRPTEYWVGKRVTSTMDATSKTSEGRPFSTDVFDLYAHFPHERAERLRGVSMFIQNLELFARLEQLIENMAAKVENESFIGLKFKMGGAGVFAGAKVKPDESGTKRRHVKMVSGMNLHLDAGANEDADVIESKSPQQSWIAFVKFLLRYGGSAFGLPLMMTLMDTEGLNYSSMRGQMEMAKKRFRTEQDLLADLCSRQFRWWLSRERLYNGLRVPDSIASVWMLHRWRKPAWPYLNPQQEVQAHGLRIILGLASRQQILEEVGEDDFVDIASQLEIEIKRLKEIGMADLQSVAGAMLESIKAGTADATIEEGDEV